MSLKDKYTWMKHIDFILIDLLCLIISFWISYYLKFDSIIFFDKHDWNGLLIIICCMNLICMFLQSTYSGILKRRYYQQFHREMSLFLSQIAAVCMIFYAFKIGTKFSREMLFTTYFVYFVSSQVIKYVWKKILNKEFSFKKKENDDRIIKENYLIRDIKKIDNRSEIQIVLILFIKRVIDIIGGIVGCIILIPLTVFVFILNKMNEEDDGPIFYTQERIGQYGKKFKMFKFRSMVVDADEKLQQFLRENEDIRQEFEINRKIKNDPRITRVGKFLRKTSLDEFPQFINVLIGEMSLVGPRAVVDGEIEKFGKYQKYILSVKPGITGNWAANGRSDTTYEERVMLECQYINNFSIWNDIKLLFKTVKSVLKKEGAI